MNRTLSVSVSRANSRLRYSLLSGWLLAFGLLSPHDKASPAPNALAVSGADITYSGEPARLRGIAVGDVHDLSVGEKRVDEVKPVLVTEWGLQPKTGQGARGWQRVPGPVPRGKRLA